MKNGLLMVRADIPCLLVIFNHSSHSNSGRSALGKTLPNDTEFAHHTGNGANIREGAMGGSGKAAGGVEVRFGWCVGSCGERKEAGAWPTDECSLRMISYKI